jgi:hypothetical protein
MMSEGEQTQKHLLAFSSVSFLSSLQCSAPFNFNLGPDVLQIGLKLQLSFRLLTKTSQSGAQAALPPLSSLNAL